MRSVVGGLPDLTIPGRTTGERARWITSRSPHHVYTVWDADGNALYVGCTRYLEQRMAQHRRAAPEWYARMAKVTTTVHPTRAAGRDAEAARIRELCPEANIQGNPRGEPVPEDDRPLTIRERKAESLRALRGGAA